MSLCSVAKDILYFNEIFLAGYQFLQALPHSPDAVAGALGRAASHILHNFHRTHVDKSVRYFIMEPKYFRGLTPELCENCTLDTTPKWQGLAIIDRLFRGKIDWFYKSHSNGLNHKFANRMYEFEQISHSKSMSSNYFLSGAEYSYCRGTLILRANSGTWWESFKCMLKKLFYDSCNNYESVCQPDIRTPTFYYFFSLKFSFS